MSYFCPVFFLCVSQAESTRHPRCQVSSEAVRSGTCRGSQPMLPIGTRNIFAYISVYMGQSVDTVTGQEVRKGPCVSPHEFYHGG